ncbi:hypothetical protein FRB94_007151 [Tulasnella sp. JGI-2019a]|nr:hypothetical protein FRB93_012471 [Tulasnella sp. JGI-2019a]KAG9011958.1 hypothetical protein FRB94_007151 [Tulasnella sp. JGI-2019a]KAG9036270.1 hypothetical protein FRB95_009418 [Tulasnella sp. JGI-2019a]
MLTASIAILALIATSFAAPILDSDDAPLERTSKRGKSSHEGIPVSFHNSDWGIREATPRRPDHQPHSDTFSSYGESNVNRESKDQWGYGMIKPVPGNVEGLEDGGFTDDDEPYDLAGPSRFGPGYH